MNELTTYEGFRADYEKRHPASVPKRETARHEYHWLLLVGVGIAFVAAMGVSGVHTAPVIYTAIDARHVAEGVRQIIAVGAIFAIEFSILLSAFLKARKLAIAVLVTAFIVAVIANIVGTLQALSGTDPETNLPKALDFGAFLTSVVLGFGAPLIALMMGELLARILDSRRMTGTGIDADYQEQCRRWDAAINAEWSKYQKLSVRVLSEKTLEDGQRLLSSASASERTDNRQTEKTIHSGFGFNRTSDAQQKAWEWFDANKERVNEPSRKIAAEIGVGHDSVAKARNLWKAAQSEKSVPTENSKEQS